MQRHGTDRQRKRERKRQQRRGRKEGRKEEKGNEVEAERREGSSCVCVDIDR